jgi:hypothetical protein
VDSDWKAGIVTQSAIRSNSGGLCRVKVNGKVLKVETEAGKETVVIA